MSEVPFYLQPTMAGSTPDTSIDVYKATEFSYDYNYGYLPEPQGSKSAWEEIAETTSVAANTATDVVWSTAKGTWESVKSGTMAVVNTVEDLGTGALNVGVSIFDGVLSRMLLLFAALVIGIVMLAKSGALKDVVSFLK